MLKRRKRQRAGIRTEARIRCPAHLAWVRGHVCAVRGRGPAGHRCVTKIISAHVRTGTDGAAGIKPSDCWVIPLCIYAHSIQHAWGEATFEKHFSIDMKALAAQLWKASPHRIRYEQRQREKASA